MRRAQWEINQAAPSAEVPPVPKPSCAAFYEREQGVAGETPTEIYSHVIACFSRAASVGCAPAPRRRPEPHFTPNVLVARVLPRRRVRAYQHVGQPLHAERRTDRRHSRRTAWRATAASRRIVRGHQVSPAGLCAHRFGSPAQARLRQMAQFPRAFPHPARHHALVAHHDVGVAVRGGTGGRG